MVAMAATTSEDDSNGEKSIILEPSTEEVFSHDVWYRDAKFPVTTITLKPEDEAYDYRFHFAADEEGCLFEYRLWRLSEEDLFFQRLSVTGPSL